MLMKSTRHFLSKKWRYRKILLRLLNYASFSGGALSGVDFNGIAFSGVVLKLKS